MHMKCYWRDIWHEVMLHIQGYWSDIKNEMVLKWYYTFRNIEVILHISLQLVLLFPRDTNPKSKATIAALVMFGPFNPREANWWKIRETWQMEDNLFSNPCLPESLADILRCTPLFPRAAGELLPGHLSAVPRVSLLGFRWMLSRFLPRVVQLAPVGLPPPRRRRRSAAAAAAAPEMVVLLRRDTGPLASALSLIPAAVLLHPPASHRCSGWYEACAERGEPVSQRWLRWRSFIRSRCSLTAGLPGLHKFRISFVIVGFPAQIVSYCKIRTSDTSAFTEPFVIGKIKYDFFKTYFLCSFRHVNPYCMYSSNHFLFPCSTDIKAQRDQLQPMMTSRLIRVGWIYFVLQKV